jgi:hypothetical protein
LVYRKGQSQKEERISKKFSISCNKKVDDDSFNSSGKILTFDGQIQRLPKWWKKFSEYATVERIKSILKKERDFYIPEKEVSEINETGEKSKLSHLTVNRNKLETAKFFIAFTTKKQ